MSKRPKAGKFVCAILVAASAATIGIALLTTTACGPAPTQICWYIEGPCSGANLNDCAITIIHDTSSWDGRWKEYKRFNGPAIPRTKRYIEGEEVFEGFWSKNGFRRHTWEEMFFWRYKRWPGINDVYGETDVRQWFKDRYTTKNFFGSRNEPKNVKVYSQQDPGYCFAYTRGNDGNAYSFFRFSGYITFPNGTRCELDFGDWDKGVGPETNPNRKPVKIKRPCTICD